MSELSVERRAGCRPYTIEAIDKLRPGPGFGPAECSKRQLQLYEEIDDLTQILDGRARGISFVNFSGTYRVIVPKGKSSIYRQPPPDWPAGPEATVADELFIAHRAQDGLVAIESDQLSPNDIYGRFLSLSVEYHQSVLDAVNTGQF